MHYVSPSLSFIMIYKEFIFFSDTDVQKTLTGHPNNLCPKLIKQCHNCSQSALLHFQVLTAKSIFLVTLLIVYQQRPDLLQVCLFFTNVNKGPKGAQTSLKIFW